MRKTKAASALRTPEAREITTAGTASSSSGSSSGSSLSRSIRSSRRNSSNDDGSRRNRSKSRSRSRSRSSSSSSAARRSEASQMSATTTISLLLAQGKTRMQSQQMRVANASETLVGASVVRADLSEMDTIKLASRAHQWHWNPEDKSHECVVSDDQLEVCFHPQCSESAAAIRGNTPLIRNGNYYYWEVTVFDKTYGTSVMFGLCTRQQRLHANDYCNLIGLDKEGWSLSHKGLIWHDKKNAHYTQIFPPNRTVTIGLLFNTLRGELSYFMDGKNLGVAFCGLNNVQEELYPVIGSTAKCTRMRLEGAYCGYGSLMERSCFTLLKHAPDRNELVKNLHQLKVPRNLITYLAQVAEVCGSQTENTTSHNQYNWNINQPNKGTLPE